jgi:hypothetical protein
MKINSLSGWSLALTKQIKVFSLNLSGRQCYSGFISHPVCVSPTPKHHLWRSPELFLFNVIRDLVPHFLDSFVWRQFTLFSCVLQDILWPSRSWSWIANWIVTKSCFLPWYNHYDCYFWDPIDLHAVSMNEQNRRINLPCLSGSGSSRDDTSWSDMQVQKVQTKG